MNIIRVEQFETRIGIVDPTNGEIILPHVAMVFRDELGRRCTRFIAECYRAQEAQMIADVLNAALEIQNPPIQLMRV